MADINFTGDRATKWIRYIARSLALIWAGWWTFFGLACGLSEGMSPAAVLLHAALPGLVFLGSAAIAWRWEAIGGVALMLEGLFVFIAYPVMAHSRDFPISTIIFVLLTMALPPLAAGFLFLASWRKSKTSGIPQNSS